MLKHYRNDHCLYIQGNAKAVSIDIGDGALWAGCPRKSETHLKVWGYEKISMEQAAELSQVLGHPLEVYTEGLERE